LGANLKTEVYAVQNESLETEANAPITRWWYETPAMQYDGLIKYIQIVQFGQCLDGYLSARMLSGIYTVYEGYLYPCDGSKPLPNKSKPIPFEGRLINESFD